jgi:plasmid maintenance system antidote protein VapI
MTEEISTEQPAIETPKPEPKKAAKPAFKRVSPEKLAEEKQPAFKRAETKAPATPAVIVQEPKTTTKPDFKEVASMIEVRNYINALVNGNYNVGKEKIKQLQLVDTLLTNKIVGVVLNEEFKSFIKFDEAEQAMKTAAQNNNIRSSLYG